MTLKKGISSKVLKTVLYGLYLFFIVFVLLEVLLRIYDPFKFRLKADRIILPVNQKQVIRNMINPRLDSIITNTRNSLGMRGPDSPAGTKDRLSIITVGGSTTECRFLNDDKTWPYRLGKLLKEYNAATWLNNAGLDGHSTFGHQVLLDDYLIKLKPDVIIFLTGVNDIENDGPSFFDKLNIKGAYPGLLHFLYNNSEFINVAVNFARGARAKKINNTTQRLKVPGGEGELEVSDEVMKERLAGQPEFLNGYGARIGRLIETCKENGIQPVFLTQPCLYGEGKDSVTGVNLATAKVEEGMNGELLSTLIGLYNARLKEVCKDQNVPVIDLALKMPKNSLYYYDQTHFTNEGAELVAHLVSIEMKQILEKRVSGRHR